MAVFRIRLDKGLYTVLVKDPFFESFVLPDYQISSIGPTELNITLRLCVGCAILECPSFELIDVKTPVPVLVNEIQRPQLEKLPAAPAPKGKTRKTKKKNI